MEYFLDIEDYVEDCDYPQHNLILFDSIVRKIENFDLFSGLDDTIGRVESEHLTSLFSKKVCYYFKYESPNFLYKSESSIVYFFFELIFTRISVNFYGLKQNKKDNNYPFYIIGNLTDFSLKTVYSFYIIFSDYFMFYEDKPLKISTEFYDYINDNAPPINYRNFQSLDNIILKDIIKSHFCGNKNYFILFLKFLINIKKDLKMSNNIDSYEYICDNYVIENFIDDYYLVYSKIRKEDLLDLTDKLWFKIVCSK